MDPLFQNFLRSRGIVPPSSPVDPVATRSYQNISRDISNTLQRNLPSSFRGAGAQNIPTNILGQVSDIAEMPPGSAREQARNQLARNLRMAERGLSPAPRPVSQGPTGSLRAPGIGTPGVNKPGFTVTPRTNIPGSPLATDYVLSRQTGMTQALGQARKAGRLTSGAARSAGGLLGPLGLVADAIYTGQDLKSSLDRGEGFARIPGLVQKLFSGNKKDTTTYSSVPGFIGPVAQPSPGLIGPPVPSVESQQGAWTTKGWDPNASRTTPGASTAAPGGDVAPPAPQLPPPASLGASPQERAYQREAARTQQMMASNPYMPQMNLYAQGQSAIQTPEDMAATRDLGLAINRAMYGDMTTPKTANSLMAGLNPPGATQPVIPMDEEGHIGQLDTAAAGVQDFMRKYAEGMKKRTGE